MTFICHWQRSGRRVEPSVLDALDRGLTRLRSGPRVRKIVGPLTLLSFVDHDAISVSERVPGQSTVLVGRLDDVAGLTSRLGGHRGTSAASSGAELADAALDKWGTSSVDLLVGDFLLIKRDRRDGSLKCWRDRVGGTPCYYWQGGHEVVLAGHLGGVMAHPAVARDPNPGYLAETLAHDVRSVDETVFRAVSRLPAGHAARFERSGAPTVRRWGSVAARELQSVTSEEADAEYVDLLGAALRDRIRAPEEAAVELSGGLDSSTLAVLATEQSLTRWGVPASTFSVVFPGVDAADETRYIRAVLAATDLDGHEVECGAVPESRMRDAISATAELPSSPNALSDQYLAPLVRERGKTALISGVGGDESFYPSSIYPAALLRSGRVVESWRTAQRSVPDSSALSAFLQVALRPSVGDGLRLVRPQFHNQMPDWITAEFAQSTSLADRLARPRPPSTSEEARLRLLNSGHASRFNEATTLLGARTGLAYTHPFWDERLLSFAAGLDESHRWRDGCFRSVQRTALRGQLPEAVRLRSGKADFSHLFAEQFDVVGGRARFADLLIADELGWVRGKRVVEMYDAFVADMARTGTSYHLWALWSVLQVDSWWRHQNEAGA